MNIFQYIQGLKTGKEANQTEFEAMKDPFLAEALDGYNQTRGNHKRQIERLQNSITKKCSNKPNYTLIGGIAAASVIILGIGTYFLVIEPDAFSNLFASSTRKSPVKETVQKNQPLTDNKSSKVASAQIITEETAPETKQKEISAQTSSIPSSTSSVTVVTNQPEIQATEIKRPEPTQQNAVNETVPTAIPTEREAATQQNTTATPERIETPTSIIAIEKPAGITSTQTNDPQITLAQNAESTQQEATQDIVKPKTKGRVTDKNGNPLSGATVSVVGANKRTTTNANGYFELEEENNSNIMVRLLGYDPVVLTGNTTQSMQIVMEEVPKE